MTRMFLFNALFAGLGAAAPGPVSSVPAASPVATSNPVALGNNGASPVGNVGLDSLARDSARGVTKDSSAGHRDSATIRSDSTRSKQDSALTLLDSLPARTWTVRLGGNVGVQFPSFPQRSRFRTDIATVVARDTLTLQQGLQSSELAPILGVELSLQWQQAARLVFEGQWCGWWNDAQAARAARQREWSLAVQVWRAGVGPDLIVPTSVFSIQGMGPLVIEPRAWLVKSSLEGRGYSEGWGSGWSVGLASSLRTTRNFELGGRVRWHQESVQGTGTWADLLETGGTADRPRWATGGLALGLWSTFDAGW